MKVSHPFLITALMFAGTAVALGAFGAHALQNVFTAKQMNTFETAVQYQMYHGLALLTVSVSGHAFKASMWRIGQWLLTAGTVLFSVSLYLYLATSIKAFAFVTPFGGSALILGWFWLVVAVFKRDTE